MKINLLVTLALLLAVSNCYDEEETEEEKIDRINSQWEFALYDLIDSYDELSNVHRDVFLHKSSYNDKVSAELKYSRFLKNQSKQMAQIQSDDIPSDYQRMHAMLLKPNNDALEDDQILKLIEFSNSMEEISVNNFIEDPDDSSKFLNKQEYEDKLATSRNISYLETIWSDWQGNNTSENHNFTDILNLAEKAALLNDDYNSLQFWEDMIQYPNGYNDAKNIWDEIEPFYKNLHRFVLDRINNYYKTNFTNIPLYLTGSKFGEDWSNLADIVLPHQQIYHDAITSLSHKTTKNIYQHCSKVADTLKFKPNGEQFWKQSNFKLDFCPAKVISFCSNEYSIILTCNKTSWIQYLNMQEKAFEIGLRNTHYSSLPYRQLRYSFIDEAIESLGSTIAIHNLPYDELIETNAFTDHTNASENFLTAKLLVALRVLPRLAYYYATDTWRINEIQYPSGDLVQSWWDVRIKYQGVEGITKSETDFLEDEYIIRNKPYLGKFLGTVLQFSFLSQLELTSEYNPDVVSQLLEHDFNSMLNDVPHKPPKDVISWHYSIEEVPYYDIKGYFSPLEEYFEKSPLEPYPFERRTIKKKVETPKVVDTTTLVTITEQTPKQNINLSRKETDITSEVKTPEDVPQNDAPPDKASGYSIGIYVLITVAACLVIIISLLLFKRLVKMRRPRTNNRRFQA